MRFPLKVPHFGPPARLSRHQPPRHGSIANPPHTGDAGRLLGRKRRQLPPVWQAGILWGGLHSARDFSAANPDRPELRSLPLPGPLSNDLGGNTHPGKLALHPSVAERLQPEPAVPRLHGKMNRIGSNDQKPQPHGNRVQ